NGMRAYGSGTVNLYLGTQEGGEVRITNGNGRNNGADIVYRDIRASDFISSSSLEYKTNIEPFEGSGLYHVNKLKVMTYHMQDDVDNFIFDRKKVGLVAEHSMDVASDDGKAIELYTLIAYMVSAIKEVNEKVMILEYGVAT